MDERKLAVADAELRTDGEEVECPACFGSGDTPPGFDGEPWAFMAVPRLVPKNAIAMARYRRAFARSRSPGRQALKPSAPCPLCKGKHVVDRATVASWLMEFVVRDD